MAAEKIENNKRSVLVGVLVAAVICYFAVTFVCLRVKVSYRKDYNAELKAQYEQQIAENEQLERIIEEGDEADYIERIAREEYGYAKPNEKAYFASSVS